MGQIIQCAGAGDDNQVCEAEHLSDGEIRFEFSHHTECVWRVGLWSCLLLFGLWQEFVAM